MAWGPILLGIRKLPVFAGFFGIFILLAIVLAGPALSGPKHELRRAVIGVIKNQMAAFQRDDGEAAFSFTSPDVQRQFVTADAYLARFSSAYKPVYRPKSVTFLNLAFSRGRLVQRVLLQGPDGRAVVALFPMVQLTDGSWRIDGCVLIPATGKQANNGVPPDFLG